MNPAFTDSELSFAAREFVWNQSGLLEAHAYLLPTTLRWLKEANAHSVLDLGCGNGAATQVLAQSGFKVGGVDSSESGIAIAARAHPELDLVCADLAEPLPPRMHGAYDAVIALEVIEHLLLPRLLFQRAKEALGGQGLFIVSTPYHGYLKNLALAVANAFDNHWHPLRDYGHVKFFSRKTLSQLFREQGFAVRRFKRVGRVPFLAKSMILQGGLENP